MPFNLFASRSSAATPQLDTLYTPSCHLSILTLRLELRSVVPADLDGLKKVKCEELVNRTQLYGEPAREDVEDEFLKPYIESSIPRMYPRNTEHAPFTPKRTPFRSAYAFAITARPSDPGSGADLVLKDRPPGLASANVLKSLDGYLGNIGMTLELDKSAATVSPPAASGKNKGKKAKATCKPVEEETDPWPVDGTVWKYPTRKKWAELGLVGTLFYELHPQLWGQGLMTEAFREMVDLAFREFGVVEVRIIPTASNTASIALARSAGFHLQSKGEDFGRAVEIWSFNRTDWEKRAWRKEGEDAGRDQVDRNGGKVLCRWCQNLGIEAGFVPDKLRGWARWCGEECWQAERAWAQRRK